VNLTSRLFVSATLFVMSFPLFSTLAFASSDVKFVNVGGTLSGTNAGRSLTGSLLIATDSLNGSKLVTGDLGAISFTTGGLVGGSLQMGAVFSAGGSFTVAGNGIGGFPNGAIFSGTFSGPVTWTLATLSNGTHNYTLTGVLTGTMGGASINAVTVQLTVNTGRGFFDGLVTLASGDTAPNSIPEPSTLALLSTGFLGLSRLVRRKLL
jgi:hypothetical protein